MEKFEKSITTHAHVHNLPYRIDARDVVNLYSKPCCCCNTTQKAKTYQNVGLKVFSKGYTSQNVMPLCRMCYKTRYGMSYTHYIDHVKKIMSFVRCKYVRKKNCRKFWVCINNNDVCKFCGSSDNLTIDRINSNRCYSSSNVQVLCFKCNRMKHTLSETTLFKHFQRLIASTHS